MSCCCCCYFCWRADLLLLLSLALQLRLRGRQVSSELRDKLTIERLKARKAWPLLKAKAAATRYAATISKH